MGELYIGGTTTSLVDWEGYVSYVIFFAGCNLRCQYCIPSGTSILMSNYSWKNIEDIKIGDWTLGLTEHSRLVPSRVNRTMSRVADTLLQIRTTGNHRLRITPEHPILGTINRQHWHLAKNILGKTVVGVNPPFDLQPVSDRFRNVPFSIRCLSEPMVYSVKESVHNDIVFNIETDTHNYIADGIVVHNCHNPELIHQSTGQSRTVASLLENIVSSRLTDAVVYTGGEPTVQNIFYLKPLIQSVHVDALKPQKLDTNGTRPHVVEQILPYLDKVSLDLKAPPKFWSKSPYLVEPGLYPSVCGATDNQVSKINETLQMVGRSDVILEGRTTVVPELIYTEQHIRDILEWAAPYIDEYTLQVFRNDVVLNPALRVIPSPTREHMEMLADVAKEYIPNVNIRPHTP